MSKYRMREAKRVKEYKKRREAEKRAAVINFILFVVAVVGVMSMAVFGVIFYFKG